LLPDRGSLLDLGCGRGVLLSLLKAVKAQYQAGLWPQDWPAPLHPRVDAMPGRPRRPVSAG